MVEVRPFRREGLGYVYEPLGAAASLGIVLRIDGLHHRGEHTVGNVLVETTLPGTATHLLESTQNITGFDSRSKLARELHKKTLGLVEWDSIIEAFCIAVIRAEREGSPFITIGNLDDEPETPDAIQYLVQTGRVNEVHGPGGDGKGWLCSFIAVCHTAGVNLAHLHVNPEKGRVLYLDWEDDPSTLNRRLKAAARGLGLEPVQIEYRQCHGALKDQVLQIAQHVATTGITLIVTDSVELACGAGETSTYQERAQGLHDALRAITTSVPWPVSNLLVDHVSDEARRNDKGVSKAYGSAFKQNWARNTWELRKEQDAGSPNAYLGLFPFKANHRPNVSPIGLKLDFSRWPQAVSIGKAEIKDSETLSSRLTNGSRILAVMGSEPLTTADIAEETGISDTTVRTELNRLGKRRVAVKTTDGRWVRVTHPSGSSGVTEVPEEESIPIPF